MKTTRFLFTVFIGGALAAPMTVLADSTTTETIRTEPVEVETVVVSPAKPASDDSEAASTADGSATESKAKELWKKTKEETGEAAGAVADYSKVQGTRALNATKKGVTKGTEAVTEGSKKAWSATKKTTKKAVNATGNALEKAGEAISDSVDGESSVPPVEDRSVEGS